jgi:hypothetical protein
MTAKLLPSLDRLRQLLDCDPATGLLTWKQRPHPKARIEVGSVAGCITPTAVVVKIDGAIHKAHRIVWLMVRGEPVPEKIDHEDTDPLHNWIDNLRAATTSQNGANAGLYSSNKSGVKGVCWYAAIGKWRAYLRNQRIGDFDTLEQAAAARRETFAREYGAFARHG